MKSKVLLFGSLFLPGIIFMSILCHSCKGKIKNYEPTYSTDSSRKKILLFGVPTQSFYEITGLFEKYLSEHLQGAQVQTVASSTYLDYMEKLDKRLFDFTIVNGAKALECARNGYSIIGCAVDEQ